jgi:hypothetical protein
MEAFSVKIIDIDLFFHFSIKSSQEITLLYVNITFLFVYASCFFPVIGTQTGRTKIRSNIFCTPKSMEGRHI